MSFLDILNAESRAETLVMEQVEKPVHEETQKPEEILRGANIKIRMITPTAFGTQIDLAKNYEDEHIKEVLKDFTVKIKGKSIFIVD